MVAAERVLENAHWLSDDRRRRRIGHRRGLGRKTLVLGQNGNDECIMSNAELKCRIRHPTHSAFDQTGTI